MMIGTSGIASATPAISFTSPTIDYSNSTDLVGWQFTVNNNITVNELGFYNNPAHGITGSHDIGIYNVATQSLIVSGTVSPSDQYNNWFNWKSVTPTVLIAGQTYDIVAVLLGNYRTWTPNGFAVDSNINYVKSVYSNGTSTLSFPNSSDSIPNSHFGPNFGIASARVPEPSTMLLITTGFASLVGAHRRKSYQRRRLD